MDSLKIGRIFAPSNNKKRGLIGNEAPWMKAEKNNIIMSYVLDSKQVGNYTVNIVPDECPESPREWCNLGTIYSNLRNINPDGHTMDEILKDDAEYIQDLRADFKRDNVYFAIHMMNHSALSFSLASLDAKRNNYSGYYMGFDCCTMGVIAVSKDKIREEYGCKRITAAVMEKVKRVLAGELDDYEKYANGYVVGFEVVDEDGDVVDSCYGYYDDEQAMDEGVSIAESMSEEAAA